MSPYFIPATYFSLDFFICPCFSFSSSSRLIYLSLVASYHQIRLRVESEFAEMESTLKKRILFLEQYKSAMGSRLGHLQVQFHLVVIVSTMLRMGVCPRVCASMYVCIHVKVRLGMSRWMGSKLPSCILYV